MAVAIQDIVAQSIGPGANGPNGFDIPNVTICFHRAGSVIGGEAAIGFSRIIDV